MGSPLMSADAHSEADFAVVGAGLAGLRAAAEFTDAGASVAVFEARDRVGGRVLTAAQPDGVPPGPPLVLDVGAQWVGPGQNEMLAQVQELRLHVKLSEVPGHTIWVVDDQVIQGKAAFPPLSPQALADLLMNTIRLGLMSRQIPADTPWRARHARQWDHLTAQEWMDRHLRTPAVRTFAEVTIRGNGTVEPDEMSMLNLLFGYRSTGSYRNAARAEMFQLREGAHELAVRLAERVRHKIHFTDPVCAISQDADGATVESERSTTRCRRVVVCVPPALAAKITYSPELPAERAKLMTSMPMGATVKFHAVYRQPFWRSAGLSGQALSPSGTVCITYDNSPDDGSGRGVLVGLVVADDARRLARLPPAQQEQEILASLGRLLGSDASEPDAIVVQDWCSETWSEGCYSANFPPGVWTRYGSAYRAACGRIHWAGTETSPRWHGYMEGALLSGKRAATEALLADATSRS